MVPAASPKFPSLTEIRRRCRRITRTVPTLTLSGAHIAIHDVRPNYIQLGHQVREHEHSFYEGHILLYGKAEYTMGGMQIMGAGGTLLHGPHALHAWREPETPCLRLLIWFSMDPLVPVPRPASWPTCPDLLWDVALLLDDAGATEPGWYDRVTSRLTVVLSRLLTIAKWPRSREASAQSHMNLIAVVDQFLRDNLARPLTLNDVADHAGLSQRSLCRQFLQMTGETVMERLANLRMDRAASLLAETDNPLAVIGADVGMPDPSYFCRRFRKHFHLTPHVYRRQMATGGEMTAV